MKFRNYISGILFLIFSLQNLFSQTDTPIVYLLAIEEDISSATLHTVIKGMEEAKEKQAGLILVKMNTYGGELNAADSIRNRFLYSPIPVWVYIEANAGSAGAIIALACDSIYMKPGSVMGAATVVNGQGEKMPEKYQSFIRAKMRETAELKGRDPRIAEAMVDENISVPEIKENGQLVTFTVKEAIQHGFCEGEFESLHELLDHHFPNGYQLVEMEISSLDQVIRFFLHPMIRSLLMLVMVIGLISEIRTPGVGFPGAAALAAAILYFVPSYLEGLAAHWEILLILTGIILLILEIFVIPGFGVAGIAGITLFAAGLILTFIPDDGSGDFFALPNSSNLLKGTLIVGVIFLIAMLLSIFISGSLIQSRWFSRVAVQGEQKRAAGFVAVEHHETSLTGAIGKAITDLRPIGWVEAGGKRVEARAKRGTIEKGYSVKLIRYENGTWEVEMV